MNSIFRKKDTELMREKAIREFRQAFPNIRKPYDDDSAFEVLFQVDQSWYTLKVFLSGDFPTTKPTIQVVGNLAHPWLDQYKQVVGCEKLQHWNKNSSIVETIRDIIAALQGGTIPSNNSTNGTYPGRPRRESSGNDLSTQTNQNNISVYPILPNVQPPVFPMNRASIPGTFQPNQQESPPPYDTVFHPPPHQTSYPGYGGSNISSNGGTNSSNSSSNNSTKLSLLSSPATQPPPIYRGNGYFPPSRNYSSNNNDINNSNISNKSNNTSAAINSDKMSGLSSSGIKMDPASSSKSYSVQINHPLTAMEQLDLKRQISAEISKTKIPDIPLEFPELNNLSDAQLERLLNDPIAIKAHAGSCSEVVSMQEMLDLLRQSNQDKIASNLRQREQLLSIHEGVEALQHVLIEKVAEYNGLVGEIGKKYFKSQENVISEIQSSRNILDQEAEKLAKKFLEGEIGVSTFVHEYMDKKSHYYKLCHKLDSIQ